LLINNKIKQGIIVQKNSKKELSFIYLKLIKGNGIIKKIKIHPKTKHKIKIKINNKLNKLFNNIIPLMP
jgi:hypothetical protein